MITLETVPPELLGWALVSLVCLPLPIPFLMARRRSARGLGRARRRREGGTVATTTDPLQLLGFVDRSGPPVFDVERFDGPDPRAGQHLTDAEVVAVAASLNDTPTADEVERWLRSNTP